MVGEEDAHLVGGWDVEVDRSWFANRLASRGSYRSEENRWKMGGAIVPSMVSIGLAISKVTKRKDFYSPCRKFSTLVGAFMQMQMLLHAIWTVEKLEMGCVS